MNTLSRRALLSALAALTSIAVVPSRANGAVRTQLVGGVARWLGLAAIPLGQLYLRSHKTEADLDVLADLLLERLQGTTGNDLRRTLALAVQEDFERDDVVYLDGWLLSRTEVRLCALTCKFFHKGYS